MKIISQEDNIIGIHPYRKTISQEDELTGIQLHRETASQEDNLTKLQEDKLGQLVWLSKVDLSFTQLSPSLSLYNI